MQIPARSGRCVEHESHKTIEDVEAVFADKLYPLDCDVDEAWNKNFSKVDT
jgi:hypothetical protein